MPTGTTHFDLQKPTPGGDTDSWGGYINAAFDIIDTQMNANATAHLVKTADLSDLDDPDTALANLGFTANAVDLVKVGYPDMRDLLGLGTAALFDANATVDFEGTATDDLAKRSAIAAFVDQQMTRMLHVEEQQTAGANGGSSVASTWTTRNLNAVPINTISGAGVASDEITLPPGTYDVFVSAPAHQSGGHKCRLYNVSDSAVAAYGTAERDGTGGSRSILNHRLVLPFSKIYRVEHYVTAAKTTDGFGKAVGVGLEVYTVVQIRKIS